MTKCTWIASDQPRQLEDGTDCPEPHCGSCGHRHVQRGTLTCPTCVGDARDDLRLIATLAAAMPEEAEERGIESEAVHLAGPVADPEAWRQRGRHGHRYEHDAMIGEDHPLWTTGTWEMLVREHLDQPTTLRLTIDRAVDYLAGHLTALAQDPDFPFRDLARDLRTCRGHLEDVLRDGEQRDTGAPCMTCEVPLVRVWGDDEAADGWMCPRCRQRSTEAQYRFAVQQLHREEATYLTDRDMEIRTGVKASTVRSWARSELVGRRLDSGRTLYAVSDVEFVARGKGLIA